MARAGLTPDRLAQAGAELADEIGFEKVTASALARHFGVQVASLYSHVRNTHDLKVRIGTLALAEMAGNAATALAGRSGRDALAALGNVYRDYARAHPGRYAAAQIRFTPEEAATTAGPRLSEMTRAVLRGYDLNDEDQVHAVRLLGSIFHGFVSLEQGGSFDHSTPASEQSWIRILDSLDATLRTWPCQ
ncbi:TetR/AcrR family transcriptional regulator [Paractinoplanes atraurantiacus]|uniref:TetR/AcrR family transcriptional regulator n=1 Tax=Paractinoplanes atraurantiacus TaxID=1036182 RepID=UPI000BE44744|nr:TetR/AcrR family transcriptional regulator [Actinoplanes atraurantiacus]